MKLPYRCKDKGLDSDDSTFSMEFDQRHSSNIPKIAGLPLADFVEVRNLGVLLFHGPERSETSWLVVFDRDTN